MNDMLTGKVCLVTGAGRGLGRDLALALARAGAAVVVNDVGTSLAGEGRDDGPAAAVVAEIEAAGGAALANVDSVADWDGAQRMVAAAVATFGRIDGIVNNAGIVRDRMFFNMTAEEWRAVLDVHLDGSFNVSRAAAPHFKQQRSGSAIQITSTSGLVGNAGQANYAAAKLGIVALSRSIAVDMARYGVRSNCIAPFAWSRMTSSVPAETPEQRARVAKLKAMRGDQVAALAVYLLGDRAADVSGQIFTVRGNELFLMNQIRPLRGVHAAGGWTPETIADRVIPAWRSDLTPLETSPDVFSWDPL